MRYFSFLLVLLVFGGCGLTDSVKGVNQITVKNNLTINGNEVHGVKVSINGEVPLTVDYGQQVTRSVSGSATHRLSATSDAFNGEAFINFNLKGTGGHGFFSIYLDTTTVPNTVKLRCDNGCS